MECSGCNSRLCDLKKPTGDPSMPPYVLLAKQINAEIHNAIAAGEMDNRVEGATEELPSNIMNSSLAEMLQEGPAESSQITSVQLDGEEQAGLRCALSPTPSAPSPSPLSSGKSSGTTQQNNWSSGWNNLLHPLPSQLLLLESFALHVSSKISKKTARSCSNKLHVSPMSCRAHLSWQADCKCSHGDSQTGSRLPTPKNSSCLEIERCDLADSIGCLSNQSW